VKSGLPIGPLESFGRPSAPIIEVASEEKSPVSPPVPRFGCEGDPMCGWGIVEWAETLARMAGSGGGGLTKSSSFGSDMSSLPPDRMSEAKDLIKLEANEVSALGAFELSPPNNFFDADDVFSPKQTSVNIGVDGLK